MRLSDERVRELQGQWKGMNLGITHYQGCEVDHPACALRSLCLDLLEARKLLEDYPVNSSNPEDYDEWFNRINAYLASAALKETR